MRKSQMVSKSFAFLLLALSALYLGACAGGPGTYSEKQTPSEPPQMAGPEIPPPSNQRAVKVALLLPLSGKNAALGQAMMNAAQMALFDVGYNSFELLPRDTKGTAQGASEAAYGAVQEGAQMILGPVFAEEVRAVKPAAQSANINVIAFSTNWELADNDTFIMGFLPFDQIDRIVTYAAGKNIKRVGVIAPSTNYGRAVIPAYQSLAARVGIITPQAITIQPEMPGMLTAVQSFAQAQMGHIDAVFMPMGGSAAAAVSGALSQGGLTSQVKRLGTGLFEDDALAGNPALDGAWFAAPSPRPRKNFEQRFMKTYGYTPPRLSTLAYDATALASALAQRAPQGGGPLFDRGAITNPNGFAGLDGIFRFRQNGMAERGLAILEYRNGQIAIIDEAPKTFQAPQP